MMTKSEMRDVYREQLRSLSTEERLTKNTAIAKFLSELPILSTSQCLVSYLSFGGEVDTRTLIASWLKENRTVFVPRVRDAETLEWVECPSLDKLTTGAHGVPEPVGKAIDLPQFADAPVIVPGLAFTKDGGRLGRGGGYFDRFLAGHTGTRIGLAFECQLANDLPMEPYDIPMDIVITESAIYHTTTS